MPQEPTFAIPVRSPIEGREPDAPETRHGMTPSS